MANICRYCKNKLPEGAKRCPHCGRAVVRSCAVCGTLIYHDEKYCPGCGSPILVNCQNCGEKLYNGERFCPYCGSKVGKGSGSHVVGTPQVNVPISLPVAPSMMPGGNGPTMYGGAPGMPIVLPPILLNPDGTVGDRDEVGGRLPRTRPAPQEEASGETEVRYEGVRTGTVGLILSLISLFLFVTGIFPIISLIVSAVGIHVDRKRGRGVGPGVAGVIISSLLILAIVAALVFFFAFGGLELATGWAHDVWVWIRG